MLLGGATVGEFFEPSIEVELGAVKEAEVEAEVVPEFALSAIGSPILDFVTASASCNKKQR